MNKTFEGKCGIKATVICDSIFNGQRITTIECEYPRIIHAEVMTHRMFSRNAASSRAIPFEKMLKQLTARPVRFGANVAGMQDKGEDHDGMVAGPIKYWESMGQLKDYTPMHEPESAWVFAKQEAVFWSKAFADAGYHKQICNRLTEPFQMIKVLITATEWDNFFWLRCDSAADPTLQELAAQMQAARDSSTPQELKAGEWHLPYVEFTRMIADDTQVFGEHVENEHDSAGHFEYWKLKDAIKVSSARSAAVSYRNVDYSLDKSVEVYDRLVGSEKKHGSALEHCATPIVTNAAEPWPEGVSHMDREGKLWSGNFKGWIQHRKLLPGENYTGE